MFKLFKKKNSSLSYHFKRLIKKPKIDFQLDIYRNKKIEFQIFRQRMLKQLGVSVENFEGFSLLVSFNLDNKESFSTFKKFKKSKLYELGTEIKLFENSQNDLSYVFKIDNNLKNILKLINQVQTQVYDYKDDTLYYFKYKEI